jgi:hypothetical protein
MDYFRCSECQPQLRSPGDVQALRTDSAIPSVSTPPDFGGASKVIAGIGDSAAINKTLGHLKQKVAPDFKGRDWTAVTHMAAPRFPLPGVGFGPAPAPARRAQRQALSTESHAPRATPFARRAKSSGRRAKHDSLSPGNDCHGKTSYELAIEDLRQVPEWATAPSAGCEGRPCPSEMPQPRRGVRVTLYGWTSAC